MGMARISTALALSALAVTAQGAPLQAQGLDGQVNVSTQSLSTSEFLSTAEFLGPDGLLDEVPLYLAVRVNGRDTGVVAEFTLHRIGRRMSALRSELDQIGLIPPSGPVRTVFLDDIPGLTYQYDEARQELSISAPFSALKPLVLTEKRRPDYVDPQPGFGAVLNYRLTTNLGSDVLSDGARISSIFADLEARAYTPLGLFVTTGTATGTDLDPRAADFIRHDSYFTYSSPRRMVTVTAGDFVTSTPPWARPIRLGGLQIRRDFSIRSDIVTVPSLSYTGTAALASSVDVYVDNIRAWSGKTEAGPFKLTDLPYITSAGEAVVVIRDSAGNERVGRLPFFAGRDVLKAGTLDFSLDAGRARNRFGNDLSDYGDETLAMASLRLGLTDKITLHAHAEHGLGLVAGSLGATAILFNLAEATVALGQSRTDEQAGGMAFATLRTNLSGVDLKLSSRRSDAAYTDLAFITGATQLAMDAPAEDIAALRPARATDTLTIGLDDWVKEGSLVLSYIRAQRPGQRNEILSASYARHLWDNGPSMRMGGFTDLAEGGFGLSIGMSMTLGTGDFAGGGLSRGASGEASSYASLARPVGRELRSFGYRINFSDWHKGVRQSDVTAAYRTGAGLAEVRLRSDDQNRVSATVSFDGSIVVAGGAILPGNYIRDGFAVVKLGVPGIPVQLHGRAVARTGIFGAALVPGLQAYRNNRISIDPQDLPLDATVTATAMTVVPARKSGVTVNFGGGRSASALLTLTGPDGAILPVGTSVRLSGSQQEFTVGYDGELWLEGLRRQNTITATLDHGTCTARFPFQPVSDDMAMIDGVMCK
ncbi:MAG: hypothetical protein RIT14_219 [Pseudomonadota bacterium]